ncbi:MAG: hypothetical protein H0W88_01055 [Parachlamydiaceae bacterium]|nr:hypothetical protein [Parachlamydiaceae bacterium]
MKTLQKLIASMAVMAMVATASTANSQEPYYEDNGAAYNDGSSASNMSVWLPIGALVAAGIIIAVSSRHSHGGSSSSSNSHFGSDSSSN